LHHSTSFSPTRPPPPPPLFPYTTLFRSTALGLHLGHQRRLFLRRPLPAALNHDLVIQSKHSFWTIQKDPASLSTLPSTTADRPVDRKSTRLNSSHLGISYAVFCLKKKKI